MTPSPYEREERRESFSELPRDSAALGPIPSDMESAGWPDGDLRSKIDGLDWLYGTEDDRHGNPAPRASCAALVGDRACRGPGVRQWTRGPRSIALCGRHWPEWESGLDSIREEVDALADMLRARHREEWQDEVDKLVDDSVESAIRDERDSLRRARERRDRRVYGTYVARREGWVKIGRSTHIPSRLDAQRRPWDTTAVPATMDRSQPLTPVLTFPDDREKALHKRFAEYRERGTEWFREEGELAAWVAELEEAA